MYQVTAVSDLRISIDRGCGATYSEGESIGFTVTGNWDVFNVNTDWWRYLEVWGSTNGALWHQVISGRWVEPGQTSIEVRGLLRRLALNGSMRVSWINPATCLQKQIAITQAKKNISRLPPAPGLNVGRQ